MTLLGVVMAGGRNVRYGGLKAFADVGGTRIVDRVIAALRTVTDEVVVIANDFESYAELALPMRADEISRGGALSGLLTALRWCSELGHDGIVVVACDMPFASSTLLRRVADLAHDADVVVPESGGRRGVEPLFAFYATTCIPAIERAIERDDLRMISIYDEVSVQRVPIETVREAGNPAVLFMNVNTPEELVMAQRIAEEQDA